MRRPLLLVCLGLLTLCSVAHANNSGAVVNVCVLTSNSLNYRTEIVALPWQTVGMESQGLPATGIIPKNPQTPYCIGVGYVEEISSAEVAEWNLTLVQSLKRLVTAVKTHWHNDNTANIVENPQGNAFFCSGNTISTECARSRRQSVSWTEDTVGPISIGVFLDSKDDLDSRD